MAPAYVAIEDGPVIEGRGRVPGRAKGELVFTTAYTGYEEGLTDPSYQGQVLTFAYPLIGNYGVRGDRLESEAVQPEAVLTRELTEELAGWLAEEGTPAIDRLDTRDLVIDIRQSGAKRCGIAVGEEATPEAAVAQLEACPTLAERTDIPPRASTDAPYTVGPAEAGVRVAMLDCGAKRSMIGGLTERGARVDVLPWDASAQAVRSRDPDVLFVSNGPGDPTNFAPTIETIEALVGELPVAGICLGQQLVALAMGGSTEKMEFGHRGVNQPVQDLRTGRVIMTSQNHGYTVDTHPGLDVTQVNVNDDTVEGLENRQLDVVTRQYHPEAHPGPLDSMGFFDEVVETARRRTTPIAAD
ncbi:MAG: glutamine-hydrolyzing carbamoyl-phosphate synthase small subunit [Halobacteriales archaeon]